MEAKWFLVKGRVQGVGFRAFVMRVASELGIVGEVWNRRDGSVELVSYAEDPAVLRSLESRLHSGPGRVDSVTGGTADPADPPYDFRASFTR